MKKHSGRRKFFKWLVLFDLERVFMFLEIYYDGFYRKEDLYTYFILMS